MLLDHIVTRPIPGAGDQDADVTVDPHWFRRVFAQDLPAAQTRMMAATQRPAAYSALAAPSGKPAWASIPSWFLIAKADHVIPIQAQKAMASRRLRPATWRWSDSWCSTRSPPQRSR